ncbi:hypothetical protein DSUL_30090 [Desulfovibrionales bacterium]
MYDIFFVVIVDNITGDVVVGTELGDQMLA